MNTIGATRLQGVLIAALINARATTLSIRSISGVAAAWLDLAIRFWLSQAFLTRAAVSIMMQTPATMSGSSDWAVGFNRLIASPFGMMIETLCPVLLLLGLFTRAAALPLLIEALFLDVVQSSGALHVYWVALLGWLFVMGSGPLSIDALLSGGLPSSAIPGATTLRRLLTRVTRWLGPVYWLLLRLWIATASLSAAAVAYGLIPFPSGACVLGYCLAALPDRILVLPAGLSLALGALLGLGLGSRIAAAIMLFAIPLAQVGMTFDDRLYWSLLLGLMALNGPGPLSLDHGLVGLINRLELRLRKPSANLPHVVIVGGGFGGVAAARGLRNAPCRITLIDERNHHLFQPLLYQVATAGLSPADIATPIRGLFRKQANLQVRLASVRGVSPATREVKLESGSVAYDYLVLATGSRHSYFGRDDWAENAPGLKTIEDATAIRRRLLIGFERAETAEDAAERRASLTFVIVGGGPTGVELAGAVAELAQHGLQGEFRDIDPSQARVILVQSAPRLLPTFPESLSHNAAAELARLGVEVRTGSKVEHVDSSGAVVDGLLIEAKTVIWAAGVAASQARDWLNAPGDNAGRVIVQPDLSVAPHANVFAVGDTAASTGWRGKPVPGLAPAAVQGGRYVAKRIAAQLRGRRAPEPFRYRHAGSLATIGRRAAVAEFGPVHLRGALAWWVWGVVHIFFLAGGRNRMAVAVDWVWAYLTGRRGSRLIVNRPTA